MRKKKPYFVELCKKGCSTCGQGGLWAVVTPEDMHLSVSYSDKDESDHLARELNKAYKLGWSARGKRK
jgi:hypothetical protein